MHIDIENAKQMRQIVDGFLDNSIWITNGKFSLLLREYSKLAAKMLTSGPKISYLIKNNFS